MTRILVIDDDPIYQKMVGRALSGREYQIDYASSGMQGFEQAHARKPDLIITDIVMPDLQGFELTRRLRAETAFARTPVLVLTGAAGLQDKLRTLEAGADDYLTKPFDQGDLAERVSTLLSTSALLRAPLPVTPGEKARLIAVHSLRGGVGCTSVAVNLSIGLVALWRSPTLLLDLGGPSGQVALMLSSPLRRTWADLAAFPPAQRDRKACESIVSRHISGLSFIPAASEPVAGLDDRLLQTAFDRLQGQYDYLIADLPHDFSPLSEKTLALAEAVVLVLSPDLASVRSATLALDKYRQLGIPVEKIRLVLNATFSRHGLLKEKIETALSTPVTLTIPFNPDLFVQAINYGQPPVFWKPEEPVSGLLEDLCFHLSREFQKTSKPASPTEAWRRVYKRYQQKRG